MVSFSSVKFIPCSVHLFFFLQNSFFSSVKTFFHCPTSPLRVKPSLFIPSNQLRFVCSELFMESNEVCWTMRSRVSGKMSLSVNFAIFSTASAGSYNWMKWSNPSTVFKTPWWIYVICWQGGLYLKKTAIKTEGIVFLNTDQPKLENNISLWYCCESNFSVHFYLKPFSSSLAYACVWRFSNSDTVWWMFIFYTVLQYKKMLEKLFELEISECFIFGSRMGKSVPLSAQLANQI